MRIKEGEAILCGMAGNPIRAPRGTRDFLPEDLTLVRLMEQTARDLALAGGFLEIRTPFFEETTLFTRSLGDTSDVVAKEMFTVPRRGESKGPGLTFRPEGTAGAARAYVSQGLSGRAPFQKWFYLGPMFRYERPQKGRERQFTQFGIEVFGTQSPMMDAEIIHLATRFFEELGFGAELEVRVNTMGDLADRDRWRQQLTAFFLPGLGNRCSDCQDRATRNVFRLLDCKSSTCQEANQGAPSLWDTLGDEAKAHHEAVTAALRTLGREPQLDTGIVRGLDYYTRTVFEVHCPTLGARSALCGGGRYDGLVEEVGGVPTPAVGFAIGFTPTEIAMTELGLPAAEKLAQLKRFDQPQVYVVAVTADDRPHVLQLADSLRRENLGRVDLDYRDKSLKSQFKEAGKSGSRTCVVLGPDEREAGVAVLRNMETREETPVPLAELPERIRQQLQS